MKGTESAKSAPPAGDPGGGTSNEDDGENICMTIMNLSTRITITVVVGIPYALKEAGCGLGTILILSFAWLTDYAQRMLIEAGELSNKTTYVGVVGKAFGKIGSSAVLCKQILYPFFVLVANNTIIGDILQRIICVLADVKLDELDTRWYCQRQVIISIVAVFITLPLSLYRKTSCISKFSGLSISFVLVLTVFTIIRLNTYEVPFTDDAYDFANIDAFKAMGIIVSAFMCQHSSFIIFNAMIKPNMSRQQEATHASVALAMIIMLTLGIVVYSTFTGNTYGNFLNNYCSTDTLMNVGRCFYIISIVLAFPGEVMITRQVIDETLFKQPTPLWRHILITVTIIALSVSATLLTSCLSIILELNGVANAAPLAFIFPPLLVMKLQKKPVFSSSNLPLMGVFVIGSAATGLGLYRTIVTIMEGEQCASSSDPYYCLSSWPPSNATVTNSTM